MDKLNEWYNKWNTELQKLCDSSRTKSLFSVWKRYYEALGSLDILIKNDRLSDSYVMSRVCIEMAVSFRAIYRKESLGEKYIEYEKHFEKRWIENATKFGGETQKQIGKSIKESFEKRHGDDYDEVKWVTHWSEKTMHQLFKSAKYEHMLPNYDLTCQFSHGTIVSSKISDRKDEMEELKTVVRRDHYLEFRELTDKFFTAIGWPEDENNNCTYEFHLAFSHSLG